MPVPLAAKKIILGMLRIMASQVGLGSTSLAAAEVDSMAALVSVGTGLVGTLVGAAIAWFVGRRQHRLETTFTMHLEFHAPELTHSRTLAGKIVREHRSMNFDVMRRTLEPEKTQHIWNVMYFYQRLWLAVKYKNIHRKYVPEMFGENFYWWYIKCYQDQLVKPEEKGELSWQAARHIEELWVWLEDNAGPGDKERWRNRAEEMADPV